jgi:hypothetical protein
MSISARITAVSADSSRFRAPQRICSQVLPQPGSGIITGEKCSGGWQATRG